MKLTEENLRKKSIIELKQLLSKNKMSVVGSTKKVLIDRILNNNIYENHIKTISNNIIRMSIMQLKDFMRTNSIRPLTGNKATLINRIEQSGIELPVFQKKPRKPRSKKPKRKSQFDQIKVAVLRQIIRDKIQPTGPLPRKRIDLIAIIENNMMLSEDVDVAPKEELKQKEQVDYFPIAESEIDIEPKSKGIKIMRIPQSVALPKEANKTITNYKDYIKKNYTIGKNIPSTEFTDSIMAQEAFEFLLDKYSLSMVSPIDVVINSELYQDMNRFENINIKEIGNTIKMLKRKPVICILFTFKLDDRETGHANLLIYRPQQKTIERFEPHGWAYKDEDFAVDEYIERSLTTLCLDLKPYLGDIEYKSPFETYFDFKEGLQAAQGNILGGTCAMWTLFMADMIFMNPLVSTYDIVKYMLDIYDTDEKYICNVIKGYIYETSEKHFEDTAVSFLKESKERRMMQASSKNVAKKQVEYIPLEESEINIEPKSKGIKIIRKIKQKKAEYFPTPIDQYLNPAYGKFVNMYGEASYGMGIKLPDRMTKKEIETELRDLKESLTYLPKLKYLRDQIVAYQRTKDQETQGANYKIETDIDIFRKSHTLNEQGMNTMINELQQHLDNRIDYVKK